MSEEAPPPVEFNSAFHCQVAIAQSPTTAAGVNLSFENLKTAAYAEHSFAKLLLALATAPANAITMEVKKISVYGSGNGYLQVVPYVILPADQQKYPAGYSANRNQLAISTMASTVDRRPQWHWEIPDSASKTRVYNIVTGGADDRMNDYLISLKYIVPTGASTLDFAVIIASLVFRVHIDVIPVPLFLEDIQASLKTAKPDENLKKLVAKREHEDEQCFKIKRIKELTMPNVH